MTHNISKKAPYGAERGVMLRELPWLALEGLIKAFLIIFPGRKMTVEELNAEGPRNYVPHEDR
jgi:hypothetical protein